jgi:hypothetical protein
MWTITTYRKRGRLFILRVMAIFRQLAQNAAEPKFTAGLNIGLLLRESVESVAYNQDPGRGKEGIHDYGRTEAR